MDAIKRKTQESRPTPSPRASVDFPIDFYQSFELLEQRKNASITWDVREAAEQYIADH